MKPTLKQAHGNWVEGDKFWGRETEIELLKTKIGEGAHILLVAQRRMGKTSLMHELGRRLSQEGRYLCLFIDLQGATSAEDAVVKLSLATHPYKNLWGRTKEVFSNAFAALKKSTDSINISEIEIKLRAGITSGDWAIKGDQLFDILAASDKKVLILMDEVPILVNRILKGDDFMITPERRKNADAFLSWLRANCQKHQNRVCIILSGSIGLEPVLRQGQLSATINHLAPFQLNPWDRETTLECIKALGSEYSIAFEDGVPELMVERLGCCIPHHVQLFFARIQESYTREKQRSVSKKEIERIYKEGMLGTAGHAELSHYEERLKFVLGQEDFTIALEMLTEAAVSKSLTKGALDYLRREDEVRLKVQEMRRDVLAAQNNILWVLEHDGYLRKEKSGYVFVSKLLRDWWEARHGGHFFTPIAQRITIND